MYVLFFIGIGGFFLRWRDTKKEQILINNYYSFFNDNNNFEVIDVQRKYLKQNDVSKKDSFFLSLIDDVVSIYDNNESVDQLLPRLNTSIDLIIQKIDLKYNLLKFIIWFIPTLGFIGTIIGIALALNRISPDSIEMRATMDCLAFSFNTTMIDLSLSSLLVFFQHIVQGNEEKLFMDTCHSIIKSVNASSLNYYESGIKNSEFIIFFLFLIGFSSIIYFSSDFSHLIKINQTDINKKLTYEKIWKEKITGMEFVFIRGGNFVLGNTFPMKFDDDEVALDLKVDDFWLAKYEVTNEQWNIVMDKNNNLINGTKSLPVNCVNWNDVNMFITKLNEIYKNKPSSKSNKKITFHIPKEHEWEYACRERGNSKVMFGDGSSKASADKINFKIDECKDNYEEICEYTNNSYSGKELFVVGSLA